MGGTKDPKLDRIRAAQPDLIFVNEEENRREDYEALSADFRIATAFPRRVDQVPEDLRRIGELCGTADRAEARAAELERALAELTALQKSDPRKFTFAYLIWRNPWMTLNADTYVSDLLSRAGGSNVFGDVDTRYPEISLRELARREPQIVLLPDEPFPFKAVHAPEITAAVPGAVAELMGGDDACWHGVRSIRGVALARRLRHQFGTRCSVI